MVALPSGTSALVMVAVGPNADVLLAGSLRSAGRPDLDQCGEDRVYQTTPALYSSLLACAVPLPIPTRHRVGVQFGDRAYLPAVILPRSVLHNLPVSRCRRPSGSRPRSARRAWP